MSSIIRPSFSFRNLPIYRVKNVGKETKNASVPHSLDFTRQVSTVKEAPLDGGKYVRYNESWFNILAQLNAIDTLDQYLMKSEEDKGTSAVSNHETTYNHSNFVLSETLENYLLINSEDKGSEAVNSHELEYDHTSFLTSADISNVITEDNIEDFLPDVGISIEDFNPSQFKLSSDLITIKDEVLGGGGISINDFNSTQFELDPSDKVTLKDGIIPSDISDLTDTQDIIPPALFFDDTYFSGAGTEVEPKSLRVENLPSGGGEGKVSKYIEIELANRASTIDISNWGNEAFDIKSGTIVLSGELMFENEAGDETPGTPNLRVFVNGTKNANRVVFYDLVFNSNTPTPYFGDVYGPQYLRYFNPHRFQITITFSKKLYVTMTAYGGSQDDNDKRTYKVLESTSEYNSNDSIKQISIGIVAPIYASAGSKIRVAQIN